MNFPQGPMPGDTFPFPQRRTPPPAAPSAQPATTTSRGRRIAGAPDTGTVALAMTGMSFYWMMPLMASRRRRRVTRATDQG